MWVTSWSLSRPLARCVSLSLSLSHCALSSRQLISIIFGESRLSLSLSQLWIPDTESLVARNAMKSAGNEEAGRGKKQRRGKKSHLSLSRDHLYTLLSMSMWMWMRERIGQSHACTHSSKWPSFYFNASVPVCMVNTSLPLWARDEFSCL